MVDDRYHNPKLANATWDLVFYVFYSIVLFAMARYLNLPI